MTRAVNVTYAPPEMRRSHSTAKVSLLQRSAESQVRVVSTPC